MKWYVLDGVSEIPSNFTGLRLIDGQEIFEDKSAIKNNVITFVCSENEISNDDIIAYTMGEPLADTYNLLQPYVLETIHGYYSDYGWGLAATFDTLDEAKVKCDFWLSKGGQYRVVSNGAVVYGEPLGEGEI